MPIIVNLNLEPSTVSEVKLIDNYNRMINYLRVSITDRCNLRCMYCVPDGKIPKLGHKEILSYEEILRVIRIAISLGVNKVRVTGGEPLVRKGVYDFLKILTHISALKDISLTTNGVLLEQNAEKIKDAGIRRINVSLDSLIRDNFKLITGYDKLDRVWRGIEKAMALGFDPIKINIVALRGINDNEIINFGRMSIEHPLHIRFIEYMPVGNSRTHMADHILTPEIKDRLSGLGELVQIKRTINDGPAQRYRFKGAKGELGFISAVSHHFCKTCNRLRLTANGKLRACLLSDHHEDIKSLLRSDASDKDIADVFIEAVKKKAAMHKLAGRTDKTVNGHMYGIGG